MQHKFHHDLQQSFVGEQLMIFGHRNNSQTFSRIECQQVPVIENFVANEAPPRGGSRCREHLFGSLA